MVSLIDLIISPILEKGEFLIVIRAIRLLRIFNLLPLWYGLERVLRTVIQIRSSLFLGLLVVFFNFIFALIGRQMFGNAMNFPDSGRPRWHFDDLWFAYLTTWQVVMGDSWTQVLYNTMRVSWWGALYFLVVHGFGSIVLVKLFVGILLDKLSLVPDRVEQVKGKKGDFLVVQDHERAIEDEEEEISDEEIDTLAERT